MEEQFKQLSEYLPFIFFIAIVLFVFGMFRWNARKMRSRLEPIAMSLGGELVSRFLVMNYVRLMNCGSEARVELFPGGENSPPQLVLREFAELGFDLSITSENVVTRAMEKIGLPIEMKIGDPMFDDKYLVSSRSRDKAQNFLLSPERRQIIDYFFSNGFVGLKIQNKVVAVQKPNYRDDDLEPSALKAHLDQLHRLISGA